MTGCVQEVVNARHSLEECVEATFGAAYLSVRRQGFVDVAAIRKAANDWVDRTLKDEASEPAVNPAVDARESSLVGGIRLADHCAQLRDAIRKQIVAADAEIVTLKASQEGSKSTTGDEGDESGDGLEALLANPVSHVDPLADLPGSTPATNTEAPVTTMVGFIVSLMSPTSPTKYTPTQIRQMLLKLLAMLKDAENKIDPEAEWVIKSAPPPHASSSDRSYAAEAVENITAAFIYSVDAKDCDCESLEQCRARQLEDSIDGEAAKHRRKPRRPSNAAALGYNGNHWAMMNWALRVAGDGTAKRFAAADVSVLREALAFFDPLVRRLESGLRILPREPRVVFRGVNVPLAAKYTQGTEVVFPPFTSTSLEGSEAMKFMGSGGTYFVLATRGGGLIGDFSHYPEQAEALLKPSTKFVVTSKMSRTLLQLLGNDFDVVFMSEVMPDEGSGNEESAAAVSESIRLLIDGSRAAEFVYSGYAKRYVEGRVSTQRPEVFEKTEGSSVLSAASARVLPLYKATDHFVEVSGARQMLLLGSGGAGKTSALVACLCHLMNKKDRSVRPLLPVFVSLPAVGAALHQKDGLDKYVREQLRLSSAAFTALRTAARVILLLDSLDEVSMDPSSGKSVFDPERTGGGRGVLDPSQNPWCAGCKTIVSCRTEVLDAAGLNERLPAAITTASGVAGPLVYHVWPFDEDDRVQFMENVAAERIRELAKQEATAQFKSLSDEYQLGTAEMTHPCVLTIATMVTAAADRNDAKSVFNKYILYERFATLALQSLSRGMQEAVLRALERLAMRMARERSWQISVADVRRTLVEGTSELPADGQETVPDGDALLRMLPSRCEDLNRDDAQWGFWHKTVAEFLVARRISRGAEEPGESGIVRDASALIDANPGVAHFVQLYKWRQGVVEPPKAGSLPDSPAVVRYLRVLQDVGFKTVLTRVELGGILAPPELSVDAFFELRLPNVTSAVLPVFSAVTMVPGKTSCALGDESNLLKEWSSLRELDMLTSFPDVTVVSEDPFLSCVELDRLVMAEFPNAEEVHKDFIIRASIRELDLSRSFPKLKKIGIAFLEDTSADKLLLPEFPEVTTIAHAFMHGFCGSLAIRYDDTKATPQSTKLRLPTFPKVTSISYTFLERINVWEVDMEGCLPSLTKLNDGFMASAACRTLKLPSFTELLSVGGDFLARAEHLESVSFPAFEKAKEVGANFLTQTELKEVRLSHCFPSATTVGIGFLSNMNSCESFDLPRFDLVQAVPQGLLVACVADSVDLSRSFINATSIGLHFMHSAICTTVVLPAWESVRKINSNFLFGTASLRKVNLPAFNEVTHVDEAFLSQSGITSLDLSASFAKIETIKSSFCREMPNCTSVALPGRWSALESVGSYFLGTTPVSAVKLPIFEKLSKVPQFFLTETAIEELDVSECFPHATEISSGFLNAAKQLRSIIFPQTWTPINRIDGAFLQSTQALEAVTLPVFPQLTSVSEGFMSWSGVKTLDMSEAFPKLIKYGDSFLDNASCTVVVLPSSLKDVENVGERFMAGTKQLTEVKGTLSFPNVQVPIASVLEDSSFPRPDDSRLFPNAQ